MHNIKLTETMQSQTNGIRNLIMRSYFSQNIPLPSKEIQKQIINTISNISDKAKRLENEATQILQKAKLEVEKIILPSM